MKIGFLVVRKNTYADNKTGVWGDEIVSRAMCEYLRSKGHDAFLYVREEAKEAKLDVCVYTTHQIVPPIVVPKLAKRNILWIQGFTYDGGNVISLDTIYEWCKPYYEIVTSSRVLANKYNVPFIIPYTGFEAYRKTESRYSFDVSFIGNIIKPFETNTQYIRPLRNFEYGIYGGDFGKIGHEEALKVISGSKINLHYGFKESIEWDMVTGRPLFLSLCEAFTMMDKVPWFMDTFKDTIAFTDGGDDEEAKIRYYLENTEEREKMAKRAHEIVRSLNPAPLLEIITGG